MQERSSEMLFMPSESSLSVSLEPGSTRSSPQTRRSFRRCCAGHPQPVPLLCCWPAGHTVRDLDTSPWSVEPPWVDAKTKSWPLRQHRLDPAGLSGARTSPLILTLEQSQAGDRQWAGCPQKPSSPSSAAPEQQRPSKTSYNACKHTCSGGNLSDKGQALQEPLQTLSLNWVLFPGHQFNRNTS